jgi:hypothetical protein
MTKENVDSTCTCDSYKNMSIKYSKMLDEYFKTNEILRMQVAKLQQEITDLKEVINMWL